MRQGADVSKAPPLGPLSGLHIHKPEDDIGVGLARPAHGPETVDNGHLIQISRSPFVLGCGS